jgi:hypothetical protein
MTGCRAIDNNEDIGAGKSEDGLGLGSEMWMVKRTATAQLNSSTEGSERW